jgi:hypothetical protein
MRYGIFVIVFYFCSSFGMAQSLDILKSMNSSAKTKNVPAETLDRLVSQLHPYEDSLGTNSINDSILFDTYIWIANGYAANFHFRQAYEVYRRYIGNKSKALEIYRAVEISKVQTLVTDRQFAGDKEKRELNFKLNQLETENKSLDSKRHAWKMNISFTLIILSAIVAIMLVSSAIRLFSRRAKIRQSRDQIKEMHRISNIGYLESGLNFYMLKSIETLKEKFIEIQNIYKNNSSTLPSTESLKKSLDKIDKNLKDL